MDWLEIQKRLAQRAYREVADQAVLNRRPWIFATDGDYAVWQQLISTVLAEATVDIKIVGSAATGFSLHPEKAGRPFRALNGPEKSSDIDVALVNAKLFEGAWDAVIASDRQVSLGGSKDTQRMRRNVYNGFLASHWVPQRTSAAQWLLRIQAAIGRIPPFRGYPLRFRAYRRLVDVYAYHTLSLQQLHSALTTSQA